MEKAGEAQGGAANRRGFIVGYLKWFAYQTVFVVDRPNRRLHQF
jgi:hypothetical protein